MAHRLKRGSKPVKPIAQRKRPAVDLLQLGEALMERGRAIISDDPVAGAVAFRDGLMIVAETNLPLRSRNFAGLQLAACRT